MTPAARIKGLIHEQSYTEASELLLEHLTDIFFTDPREVAALVQALPPRELAARPVLRMVLAFAAPLSEIPSRGFTARLSAPVGFEFDELSEDERDWYLMGLLVMHRMRGEFAEAHEVAARVRPRLRRIDAIRSRAMQQILPTYFTQIGAAEMLGGHLQQALEDFEEAASVGAPEQASSFLRDARVRQALLAAAEGRLRRAEALLAEAAAFPLRDDAYAARVTARERLAELLIAVERGDEQTVAALDEHGRLADDESWPLRLLAAARWANARSNPAAVLDMVEQVKRRHPIPAGSLADTVVSGAAADARTLLGASGRPGGTTPTPDRTLVPAASADAARRLLYTADATTALVRAQELVTRAGVGPLARAEALLVVDWARRLAMGEPDADASRAAAGLIAQEGLWRVLAYFPAAVRETCLAWMGEGAAAAPSWLAAVRVAEPDVAPALTPREQAVLRRLAAPGSLGAIAAEMHVSVNTVKTQVTSIYRRLGVGTREDAVREAARRGLAADPR